MLHQLDTEASGTALDGDKDAPTDDRVAICHYVLCSGRDMLMKI